MLKIAGSRGTTRDAKIAYMTECREQLRTP
jgi:hypothetical protein